MTRTGLIVAVYLGAIVAANLLVATFGPAISVVNAFAFVGLDLTTRDLLDDRWRGRAGPMLALIVAGGVISYAVNRDAGQIAVASTVAFLLASSADWLVYHALERSPRARRVMGSNVVGAAVDSLVFPLLAFGWPPLVLVMLGQFVAKVAGGAVWYAILRPRRRFAEPEAWEMEYQYGPDPEVDL